MYLSRMQLDIKKRETMKALASPSMIHGAVESAFSGERKRRLWRIDCLNGKWYLMIVSEEKPDLTSAVKQFGIPDDQDACETRDYKTLLDRIRKGDCWHFRLTSNPTVSRMPAQNAGEKGAEGEKVRGKVYAHLTPQQQEQWLLERAPSHGFFLEKDGFRVVHQEWYTFRKKNMERGQISILGVTYEGILCVSDSDLFCRTLCEGIGRGKAYGMGMLTVAGLIRKDEGIGNE